MPMFTGSCMGRRKRDFSGETSILQFFIFPSASPQIEYRRFKQIIPATRRKKKEKIMAVSTKPIPPGFHTVTPSLVVRNAAEAIDFYKKALGAEEIMRMPDPSGRISHAELKIGDSIIFLSDEFPNMPTTSPQTLGGCTGGFYLYVPDVDKSFQRAVDAGGKATMPVSDMFWGDRLASLPIRLATLG